MPSEIMPHKCQWEALLAHLIYELAAAKEVHVEVGHYLPALSPAVDHQSIASFRDAFGFGQLISHTYHVANKSFILKLGERWDVLFGHNEDMGRGLWVYIPEGDDLFILMQDFACYLSGDNLTENTGHG